MKLVTEQEAEKHNDFEHIAMKLSKMKQRKKDLIIFLPMFRFLKINLLGLILMLNVMNLCT